MSSVKDFWSGVWKRWYVRGPRRITVEVARQRSFNTLLPMLTLDRWDPMPRPYIPSTARRPAPGRALQGLDELAARHPAAWSGLARLAAAEVYRQGERASAADRLWAAWQVGDHAAIEPILRQAFGLTPREMEWEATGGLGAHPEDWSGAGQEVVMGWLEKGKKGRK